MNTEHFEQDANWPNPCTRPAEAKGRSGSTEIWQSNRHIPKLTAVP
jgi:hypothetical protein